MSTTSFRSFLSSKNDAIKKTIEKVSDICKEDDWMSSEKIDILINEIKGLRKDIRMLMENQTTVSNDGYMPMQESTARKPRIIAHRPSLETPVASNNDTGFGSEFDAHVAALC